MSHIDQLLTERHSVRAFIDRPVSEQQVRDLMASATKAASGGNMQPWNAYILAGDVKDQLVAAIDSEIMSGKVQDEDGASSYPTNLKSPYRERRYECGMALYEALDIGREDKMRRKAQWQENYKFFGAPVGLIFTLDKQMGAPQYIDLGIYLQTLMLVSQEAGLSTCAQRSWSSWPTTCAKTLNLPEEEHVIVGMTLGYEDASAPINQYRVGRTNLDEVCQFRGF